MESASRADSSRGGRIRAVLRLLLLRNAYNAPAVATPAVVFVLALVAFATWLGVDWLENRPHPSFYGYGIPGIAWYVVGILLIAAVVARRSTPRLTLNRAVVIVLAVVPVVIGWGYVISALFAQPWAAIGAVAACVYFVVYLARALHAMTGYSQPGAVVLSSLSAAAFVWVTMVLGAQPNVWWADEADGGDEVSSYAQTYQQAEALLFAQPARIDAALAAIPAGDAEEPQAYFVGFAGYGEQRVFAEEIKLAQRAVDRRYGSGERSLLLINDRRDLQHAPFATVSSLRYTLDALAAKMDPEQDILFLALSSHGSKEWAISVSNGALPLNDLTAAELAALLRDTGIKWRVIVISACYAGGFIDSLQDPYTVVIAAAAKDRTSFGCSDDRDLTYFGEAFYRDALPKAASLRDAFNEARQAIAAREKREGVTPSRPQAYFGAQIESQLRKVELQAPPEGR